MGTERAIDEGRLIPVYTAGSTFAHEIAPLENMVLKGLRLYYAGDHTTNITTAQTDGEANVITELQIEVPRVGMSPIVWNWTPRDLKQLTAYWDGALPASANPTATTGVHFGEILIPFAPPKRMTSNYDAWGIPSQDINGKIRIRGTYGAVTAIGTGSTAITHETNIVQITERPNTQNMPQAALMGIQNRINIESDARHGPQPIQTGLAEMIAGLFLRQHDVSDQAAQRQDGLVSRWIVKTQDVNPWVDQIHAQAKRKGAADFSLDAAGVPTGIALLTPSRRFIGGEMIQINSNTILSLTSDTSEVVSVEYTNITPAAGDAVFANVIGAQRSSFASA